MIRVLALALLLAACDGDSDSDSDRRQPPTDPAGAMQPAAWDLRTITPNKPEGYAVNMPAHPSPHPEGWSFDFGPDAEPHYITYRHGPLIGKTQIRMSYRAEAAPETVIHGKECPVTSPSAVTLYIQKAGGLGGDGDRWWATFATAPLAGAGAWEIVAPLDGKWTSVENKTWENAPADFAAAKRDADRVGFTFANCTGYGHGARATGPVKFVVTNYSVE